MLNKFEQWLLQRLLDKIVRQDHAHNRNITRLYRRIYCTAERVFYEDNKPTLDSFLDECYQRGKEIAP